MALLINKYSRRSVSVLSVVLTAVTILFFDSSAEEASKYGSEDDKNTTIWMYTLSEDMDLNKRQMNAKEISEVEKIYQNGSSRNQLFAFSLLGTVWSTEDYLPEVLSFLSSNDKDKISIAVEITTFTLREGSASKKAYLGASEELKSVLSALLNSDKIRKKDKDQLTLCLEYITVISQKQESEEPAESVVERRVESLPRKSEPAKPASKQEIAEADEEFDIIPLMTLVILILGLALAVKSYRNKRQG